MSSPPGAEESLEAGESPERHCAGPPWSDRDAEEGDVGQDEMTEESRELAPDGGLLGLLAPDDAADGFTMRNLSSARSR